MDAPYIALTGSTGFVGRALLEALRAHGYRVRILLRRPVDDMPDGDSIVIGDLARPMNLSQALEDIDVVVHSAALTHAMTGRPEDDFRAINTDATVAIAKAAKRAGAKRFVFLSSVRAQSGPSNPDVLTEESPARPTDAYGRSKLAAEQGLADVGIEWAALRSVLVYGDGADGNLKSLLKIARTPLPVPLPSPSGRRSVLALENLTDAVRVLIATERPLAGPYLVADAEPLTVSEIVSEIRRGARRLPMTVPLPAKAFCALADRLGYEDVRERLTGDLVVDTSRLQALGWSPGVTSREGLRKLGRG